MQKQAPARTFQGNPALAHLAAALSDHSLRRADILFLTSETSLNPLRFSKPQLKAPERKAGILDQVPTSYPQGLHTEGGLSLWSGSPGQIPGEEKEEGVRGARSFLSVPACFAPPRSECRKRPDIPPSPSLGLLLFLRDGIKPVQIRR